jgi:putative isomerase
MISVPDIWGEGILFGFSGMDGETSWEHPMVASTRSAPPGLYWPWYDVTLHFDELVHVGEVRLAGNDVANLDLIGPGGRRHVLHMAFLDRRNLLGTISPPLQPSITGPERHTMALQFAHQTDGLRFALALNAGGQEAAQQQAQAALHETTEADFEALFAQRVAFFARLPDPPVDTDPQMSRLYAKACSVLKVNAMTAEGRIAHRWTTPDRWPHRHMWLWDSAFHAPAYAWLDPSWGQDALLAVLDLQHEDGMIAHMMTPMDTSKITQPPILAWACWQVYQVSRDVSFLQEVYSPLCRYLEWDMQHRDWNGNGLLGWLIEVTRTSRSGESGMDNSCRFDGTGPWDSVDLNAYAVNDMRHLALIARELGLHAEAVQWEGRSETIGARMNELLWDEETGFYYDRHVDGELLRLKSNAGFLPLFAGVASPEQAAQVVEHLANPEEFWAWLPVPTISLDEPSYEPDMWRGPTWININHLIVLGLERYGYHELAQEIRKRTLAEIARWYGSLGCIYEYYDCMGQIPPPRMNRKGGPGSKGAVGFGVIADYNWSAACTVAMLLGT